MMPYKKKCGILIPVWKRFLNAAEVRSFAQCKLILGGNEDYEIILFGPERLDEKYYQEIWKRYCCFGIDDGKIPQLRIVKFQDRCFESRLSYSHLLSSKEFYRNFTDFKYILIYQLDAWVFSDELGKWCDDGYDLVGAPWCHLCRLGNDGDCSKYHSSQFVGNGGLSLRNVESFIDKLPYETFDEAMYNESISEDIYVSMIREFLRPSCMEACKFSVETNAKKLIDEVNGGKLPFGFHGLQVYDGELFEKLCGETFKGKDMEIFKNGR